MNSLLLAMAWLILSAPAGNSPAPATPSLAGNWKGWVTERGEADGQKIFFIVYQNSDSLHGFSRCYMNPGAYADSRFHGRIDSGKNQFFLVEDSLIAKKNTGGIGALSFEKYQLQWNATADTLRGACFSVRGKVSNGRKVVLWRVEKDKGIRD